MRVLAINPIVEAVVRLHPVKEMARLASVTPRTAQRWRSLLSQPSASALLRLIARSQRIRQLIAEQLADEWLDAEEARLRDELASLRARSEARRRHASTTLAQAAVHAVDAGAAAALGKVEPV